MAARKAFVTVQFTPEAREVLRKASLRLSLEFDRRVSMPDAFLILNAVAQQHPEEIAEAARRVLALSSEAEDENQ